MDRARARDALARALARRAWGARLVEWEAPLGPPEGLISLLPEAVFWGPPGGPVTVGLGAARVVEVRGGPGPGLADEAARALAGVEVPPACGGAPAHRALPPLALFGGLAFAPGGATGPWAPFGDGALLLPRWRYTRVGEEARLSLVVDDALDGERAAAELELILDALGAPLGPGGPARVVEQLAPEAWAALVDEARAAIRAGAFEKLVASRVARLEADTPLSLGAALARLEALAPESVRFAVRRGGATLLGATPERLVERRGERVRADALAGSRPAGEEEALLASEKDRQEHAVVVRALAAALDPLCSVLEVPDAPGLKRLRHLVHLHTPIEGRLRNSVHVLELMAALHPTPAVAGWPRQEAMAWLAAREPAPRGWYAGPIGWCDAGGDGELVVALRCALVRDREAFVHAGAGIVAASVAAAEYEETAIKQRAAAAALGALA